jgi:methyltransferase-like protein 6
MIHMLLCCTFGRYDEAQLRFKKGSKLGENFYVRQDGTCSYFFDLTELQAACAQVIEAFFL